MPAKTIKEIQAEKKRLRELDTNKTRITNLSTRQLIPIQIYGKKSKLVIDQTTINIPPGKHADLPTSRLIEDQITTLVARRLISVRKVSDIKHLKEISKNLKKGKKTKN